MLRDTVLWTKIGRIIVRLSERLNISPNRVLDIFYESKTCEHLHNESTGFYLYGDLYIIEELMRELQDRQG